MEHIMSTIAIRTSKKVIAIKCMYDGDFKTMGNKLMNHYSKSYMPVLAMMKKGYLVALGNNLKKYDKENEPNGTLDLTGVNKERKKADEYPSLADLLQTETKSSFLYVWDVDRWYAMEVTDNKPYMGMLEELRYLV